MRRFDVFDSSGKRIASGSSGHPSGDDHCALRFGETYCVNPANARSRNRGRLCTLTGVVSERTGEGSPDFFGLIVRYHDTRRQGRVGLTELDYPG